MAEAVGLTASIISIVGLAGKIVEGIIKLKGFVDDVKHAPEDMKFTLAELERLADVISDFDNYIPLDTVGGNVARHRRQCIESCQRALKVVQGLITEFERSRWRAGMRMVLNKSTTTKVRESLRDAQLALILSHTIYFEMIKEQRHQQMFKLVQETHIIVHNIRDQVATTTQAVGSSSQDTQIVRTNQVNKVLAFQTPSYLKSRKGYGISIPAWLRLPFQYIEFTAWSQTYHTDWHLRDPTQRVHAWTSDAIVAIWKGDTTMMRQMILEGLVSPNDVYADGQSLFKEALGRRLYEMCILMFDTGYNPEEISPARQSEGCGFHSEIYSNLEKLTNHDYLYRLSPHRKAERLILQQRFIKSSTWTGPDAHQIQQHMHIDDISVFRGLLESCAFDYNTVTDEVCMKQIFELRAQLSRDFAAIMKYVVRDKDISRPGFKMSHPYYGNLLHCFTYMIVGYSGTLANEWDLARRLILAGMEIHAPPNRPQSSALFEIFRGLYQRSLSIYVQSEDGKTMVDDPFTVECRVYLWLRLLLDCGIDLVDYGRREKHLHTEGLAQQYIYDDPEEAGYRLVSFTYGSRVEDWKFYIHPIFPPWSEQFWDMVEHPERLIPGAWTDDESHPRHDWPWWCVNGCDCLRAPVSRGKWPLRKPHTSGKACERYANYRRS